MRFAAVLVQRAGESFRRGPSAPRIFALAVISSGGLVAAYADAKSDQAQESPHIKKKLVVLGTGWAGTSFLKNLDGSIYDVQVVSPRNYFAFTPLLPSVTNGTIEPRSIVEPIRNIIKKKNGEIRFCEAECFKIDPVNKKIHCRANVGTNLDGYGEFTVDYDYLVVAMGAKSNTFNTPGVEENCHFLKEIEDAQRIRRSVMDCFERASLPHLSKEDRAKSLHFIVVGGGPTGVEFAAELHDFVTEDLSKLYPTIHDLVKISVIEAGEHILTISRYPLSKNKRQGHMVCMTRPACQDSIFKQNMTHTCWDTLAKPHRESAWVPQMAPYICLRGSFCIVSPLVYTTSGSLPFKNWV